MTSAHLIPSARISDYVERMLIINHCNVNSPFTLPLFANGTPTLLFLSAKATIDGKNANHLTLFGQTVLPESLRVTENFTLIAYFLKPFAVFDLFKVAAKELTDYPVDLSLIQPQKSNELKERLLNAKDNRQLISLIDDYVFELIEKRNGEVQLIKFAAAMIAQNPTKESLAKVQDKLCMTERTFERLFDKNIGISPNLFRRICQFNTAFQQLNLRRFDSLSDLAFNNGYADQSHFIRSFREFTNITPKEYLNYGRSAD